MKVKNTTKFQNIGRKTRIAIGVYGQSAASKMEGYAKENASWIDRTTNARNSLAGDFTWQGNKAVIRLSGNMDYSVYLELAMEKQYAILVPTIKEFKLDVLKGYERMLFKGV